MYFPRYCRSVGTFNILDRIYYRYHQASLLRSWRPRDHLHIQSSELNPIRQHFPSLYRVSVLAIKKLDHFQVGEFLSIMRHCAILSCIVLMQHPSASQLEDWCERLRMYIVVNCINVDWALLELSELMTLLQLWLDERRAEDSQWGTHEAVFFPLDSVDNLLSAEIYNSKITDRFWRAWLAALNPVLREHLTFREFVRVSKGLKSGETSNIGLPDPWLELEVLLQTIELGAEEYRAVGERIAPDKFCKHVDEVPKETSCTVCVHEVKIETNEKVENPVVTACGHVFHELCLDTWVNDSAASTAHTCPSCRTVMCEARPRVLASMVDTPGESRMSYEAWARLLDNPW